MGAFSAAGAEVLSSIDIVERNSDWVFHFKLRETETAVSLQIERNRDWVGFLMQIVERNRETETKWVFWCKLRD